MIDSHVDVGPGKIRLLAATSQRRGLRSRSVLVRSAADGEGRGQQAREAVSDARHEQSWQRRAVTVLERPDALVVRQVRSAHAQRAGLIDLSSRLVIEFAGELPASQVLACATLCTHQLVGAGVRGGLAAATEVMARSRLTAQLARLNAPALSPESRAGRSPLPAR